MTSPYRALPVIATATRAVCAWCKHSRRPYPPHGVLVCDAHERLAHEPVEGYKIVDRGRDCYIVRSMLRERGEEDCPDFEPTIATRIVRAIGGRR